RATRRIAALFGLPVTAGFRTLSCSRSTPGLSAWAQRSAKASSSWCLWVSELRRSWARLAATVTEPVRPRGWKKAATLAAGMGARPGPRLSGLDILDLVWTGKSPPRQGRAGLGRGGYAFRHD